MIQSAEFSDFLVKSKRSTYAAGARPSSPSRPGTVDLVYREGPWLYIDAYLGGKRFIGEEAVWYADHPVWGMNYYGWMLVDPIPDGFSPFLKEALKRVSPACPYRGPRSFELGVFQYFCSWQGDLDRFAGEETILIGGVAVYQLSFHGGSVVK